MRNHLCFKFPDSFPNNKMIMLIGSEYLARLSVSFQSSQRYKNLTKFHYWSSLRMPTSYRSCLQSSRTPSKPSPMEIHSSPVPALSGDTHHLHRGYYSTSVQGYLYLPGLVLLLMLLMALRQREAM